MKTVQAPQSPASQPIFVPVRPSCSRRTRESRRVGGAVTETSRPFTRRVCRMLVSVVAVSVAILGRSRAGIEGALDQLECGFLAVGGGAANVVDGSEAAEMRDRGERAQPFGRRGSEESVF